MERPLRVALFTDSYTEANGVATVSQKLAQFAEERGFPFLCVHGGPETKYIAHGSYRGLMLRRGFAAFKADHELYCDPLLSRHRSRVLRVLRDFEPDLVHITGPGDIGIMGFWVAHTLRVPLAASWHTNLHEYTGRRLEMTLARLPERARLKLAAVGEALSLDALMRFYRMPRFLMAPNQPMADLLEQRTGRPAFLMGHGVDLSTYAPRPCVPKEANGPFRIGYVGRLTPEKNVRSLAALEQHLVAAGAPDFRFLLVGEGSEQDWLRRHMRHADLPGVLRGQALADAFLSMDAFVFPSRTDTYGLVVLEAMASGVPVVVNRVVSAALGLADGVGGLVAEDPAAPLLRLMREPELHRTLAARARLFACPRSWQSIFEQMYGTYEQGLAIEDRRRILKEKAGWLGWFVPTPRVEAQAGPAAVGERSE